MAAFKAKDYVTAFKIWSPLAAQGDDPNAQANLGNYVKARGLGVDRDPETAMQLFQAAAAKGNGQAEFQLGLMYAKGVGVQQDYAQAMRYYEMASEQGDAGADYGIPARLFEEGFGVTQDDKGRGEVVPQVGCAGRGACGVQSLANDFEG